MLEPSTGLYYLWVLPELENQNAVAILELAGGEFLRLYRPLVRKVVALELVSRLSRFVS